MNVDQDIKKKAKRIGQAHAPVATLLDQYLRACRLSHGADAKRSAYWHQKASFLESQLRQTMDFIASNKPLELAEADHEIPSDYRHDS